MRWSSLAFFHWPIEPAKLRHLIPLAFELDTFNGRAWVGLVPFTMPLVRHRGWPRVPTMHAFHECNVRTYVKINNTPGVWFFSLDAASRLAAWGARTFWNLPYHHARISLAQNDNAEVTYSVERCSRRRGRGNQATTCRPAMRARWRIGPPLPSRSREGDLGHFLTERYCLYSLDRRGRAVRARIHHNPWPLREATVLELEESLIPAAGIELDTNLTRNPPIAWHADELDVRAWGLEKC